ncbi:GntR family transcriptional regulator [Geminicoccus flavidas]|uniref:GntR family transcriptional regulator n=1 Tax=Geminicoccus flavidas TaxID=2506407 RepID=UPI00135B1C32|nr:GntR family transcriptional regulator [Geminicoccus flavidas]
MSSRPQAAEEPGEPSGAGFSRITKESLSDRAYLEIRTALMRSRLRPGQKLQLRPLSAELGLSATPVREALLRLVSEQALELDERGTAVVPRLDRARLLEVRDLRAELEGKSTARAAEIADPAEIARLEEIHAGIPEALAEERFQRAVELNERFHLELCAMARLPILYQFVTSLWLRCGPILSHLYDDGVMEWDVHPHVRIIEALHRRDPEAARTAMRQDIIQGGSGLLRYVDEAAPS